MEVTRSISGEWSLSASNELTSAQLARALEAVDASEVFRAGPESAIAAAILELISVTSRPPWMDDDKEETYQEALCKALWDYPIDVVVLACSNWRRVPSHGKWWPMEQDLRAQCEQLVAPRKALRNKAAQLLVDLQHYEHRQREAQQRSSFASDAGRAFREEMRKRMSASRFDAYFHPSQVMYQEGVVHVRTRAAERVLTEEGADLLERHRLRVEYTSQAFTHVRQPQWEDDTPEERAIVSRKLNRLNEGLSKGLDLRRLRERGEI